MDNISKSNIRKFDFKALFEKNPQTNLRSAAKAYLNTAIQLYLKLEGKVSIWLDYRFGDSANIVCSLNRAVEHLLKLRLLKLDPMLLFPIPRNIQEYCRIKEIQLKDHKPIENQKAQREAFSHTISFREALERVDLTQVGTDYNFRSFAEIYSLRNSLEHHWDRNEEFLQRVVGNMSSTIIPSIRDFIKDIINEDPDDYFDTKLLQEVKRLDRANEMGHSLKLQQRFEEHQNLFLEDPDACKKKYSLPNQYEKLSEKETDAECPICKNPLMALYDWEADYDVEGEEYFPVGAYPDTKCLYCINCHFFIEGIDIGTYLPDGIEVEVDEEFSNEYEY